MTIAAFFVIAFGFSVLLLMVVMLVCFMVVMLAKSFFKFYFFVVVYRGPSNVVTWLSDFHYNLGFYSVGRFDNVSYSWMKFSNPILNQFSF